MATMRPPFETRAKVVMARSISLAVAHVDRAQLHSERRRRGLDRAELSDLGGYGGIPNDRRSCHARRNLLEQLQPFCRSDRIRTWQSRSRYRPVAPSSPRNRPPTGSMTPTNTIGTRAGCLLQRRHARSRQLAKMTSGASATNSAACLRMWSALPAGLAIVDPHVAALVQPNSLSACRNAPMRA